MQDCAAGEYLRSQAADKKAEIQIVMIFCCFRKLICIKMYGNPEFAHDVQTVLFFFFFPQLLYCHFSQSWKRSACPGMVVLEGL